MTKALIAGLVLLAVAMIAAVAVLVVRPGILLDVGPDQLSNSVDGEVDPGEIDCAEIAVSEPQRVKDHGKKDKGKGDKGKGDKSEKSDRHRLKKDKGKGKKGGGRGKKGKGDPKKDEAVEEAPTAEEEDKEVTAWRCTASSEFEAFIGSVKVDLDNNGCWTVEKVIREKEFDTVGSASCVGISDFLFP